MALFVFSLCISSVSAKKFSSQYCEFELPAGWECVLEGTEWVCQPTNKDRQKEAIIIMAAKIAGSQDSLPQYQSYLKKRKTFTLPGGKVQVSEPKYTKSRRIQEHPWIDSLHLASEVPGFYTRYLATVKKDLGIAVTFSVAKEHYDSYRGLFEKMIESLRVFRQSKESSGTLQLAQGTTSLGEGDFVEDSMIPEDTRVAPKKVDGGGGKEDDGIMLIIIVAAVAGIGFGLSKLKKKK